MRILERIREFWNNRRSKESIAELRDKLDEYNIELSGIRVMIGIWKKLSERDKRRSSDITYSILIDGTRLRLSSEYILSIFLHSESTLLDQIKEIEEKLSKLCIGY